MSIRDSGSNRTVDESHKGSVFPVTEKETVFNLLVDGAKGKTVHVEGSVYGKNVTILGDVLIEGPVVSRGDVRLEARGKTIRLLSGITANGSINLIRASSENVDLIERDLKNATLIVRGDIVSSNNVFLSNAIILGSIRAQNCKLERCILLGTANIDEKLTVSRTAIAGYIAETVVFEGPCTMIHALGESSNRPVFAPHEDSTGVAGCDMRYYPIIREQHGFINQGKVSEAKYPIYSKFDPIADWVVVEAQENPGKVGNGQNLQRWVLSLGGRIADFRSIQESISALAEMLKCGFEFEHYQNSISKKCLESILPRLNADERWILTEVCQSI